MERGRYQLVIWFLVQVRSCLMQNSTPTLACPILLKVAVRGVIGLCGGCFALWCEGCDGQRDVVKSIIEEVNILPRETGALGSNPILVG